MQVSTLKSAAGRQGDSEEPPIRKGGEHGHHWSPSAKGSIGCGLCWYLRAISGFRVKMYIVAPGDRRQCELSQTDRLCELGAVA